MITNRTSVGAAALAVAGALAILTAQPTVVLQLEPALIAAGQMTTAVVTAPAGVSVTIRSSASTVPPHTVVGTGSAQRVTLGPFVSTGDYQVIASAGAQTTSAALRVTFPQEAPPAAPPGEASRAYLSAADALIDAANSARTGLARMPAATPTVAEAKAAVDELQRQLAEVRRAASDTGDLFDAVGQELDKDATATRESKDEFSRLAHEISQNLADQARQLGQLSRDAAAPAPDPCAAAMAVSAALQASRSTMNVMRNGVRQLQAGQARREAGGSAANASAWRQIKAKIEDLVQTGQAGSYAEAERSIGRATGTGGLGGHAERLCDKFTGEWSGTTYVEALEKGEAFYGLQNDWTAHVEIAVAPAGEGGADVERPLRGTLTGTASNFKVVNQLRTLYAGRPAQSIDFLTVDPTPAQQASATFVGVVEGFVRGTQMTLKLRPGGVDYDGRVTGKIAAVVIPMGSPVPLVQAYDVSFQGGNWQLWRAVGPGGTPDRPFTITVGGDKRLVQARYPRTLSAAGARGRFTIDVRLCSGCD